MILVGSGTMWLFRSVVVSLSENEEMLQYHPLLVSILYGIVLVTWFRVFAAVVVRRSIQKGIQILSKEIRELQRGVRRADRFLLIGFSWGGAVRYCFMLLHFSSLSRHQNEKGKERRTMS
jgi:hypothetical protein